MKIRLDCNKCGAEDLGGYLGQDDDGNAVIMVDQCDRCRTRIIMATRRYDGSSAVINHLEAKLAYRRKTCFDARAEVERLKAELAAGSGDA